MDVFAVFAFWGLLCVGVGALAHSRGRSAVGFFLLSVFFTPLLGLIVVLVIQDLNKKAERDQQTRRDHEQRLEEIKALTHGPTVTLPTVTPARPAVTGSIADELVKLADLRDRGVLTQDEFAQQKATLLAGAAPAKPDLGAAAAAAKQAAESATDEQAALE